MDRTRRFICCVFLCVLASTGVSAQTYTRTTDVPPVRLTYNDLINSVQRAHKLIKDSNSSYSVSLFPPLESLEVGDGQTKVTLSGDLSAASLQSAPSVAFNVHYRYSYDGAPLSSVDMRLDDYSRWVTVEGSSQAEVDALSSLISSDLNRHSVYFAGFPFRNGAGTTMFVVAILVIWIAIGVPLPQRTRFLFSGLGVLMVIAVLMLPWNEWLAGTAVYADNAVWYVRHEAAISFIGTCVGIATIIAAGIRYTVTEFVKTKSESLPESEAPPGNNSLL